jgi:DNA-binding transcriptional ArsR family regulator
MKTSSAVTALSALAQDSRLSAFRLLVRQGPNGLPAGLISDKLGVPPATLSFHLSQLTKAGLIKFRRQGRSVFYSANFNKMQSLLCYLSENCGGENGIAEPARTTIKPRRRVRRSA